MSRVGLFDGEEADRSLLAEHSLRLVGPDAKNLTLIAVAI